MGVFSATLRTTRNQTISAKDTVATSITGTSNVIDVFVNCGIRGDGVRLPKGATLLRGIGVLRRGRPYVLRIEPSVFVQSGRVAARSRCHREFRAQSWRNALSIMVIA